MRISSLKVMRSAAGYYIGRSTADGAPYSRDSLEYWRTAEEAQSALDNDTWTRRMHP